jgi:TetR/AcrR family transcriptional repressor of nem operon
MDTQQRLIESTRELLWERGYVGTSPKAIQQLAGAGQGSMYHHFSGKAELALAALQQSAEQLRSQAEEQFGGSGHTFKRVSDYLLRERDVLRGCRIGRMAQDPDIVASPELREPLEHTFAWLRQRLETVLAEGQARGELLAGLNPKTTAAMLLAVLQGGYVLARAANSVQPYRDAIQGALSLLMTHVAEDT